MEILENLATNCQNYKEAKEETYPHHFWYRTTPFQIYIVGRLVLKRDYEILNFLKKEENENISIHDIIIPEMIMIS
jgi:hypothetical protein